MIQSPWSDLPISKLTSKSPYLILVLPTDIATVSIRDRIIFFEMVNCVLMLSPTGRAVGSVAGINQLESLVASRTTLSPDLKPLGNNRFRDRSIK